MDADNGIKLILTNNTFENMENCADDGITVYGIYENNITATDNKGVVASEVWVAVRNASGTVMYNASIIG